MKLNQTTPQDSKIFRYRVFYIIIAIVFAFYGIKLFVYQIINHNSYLAVADENRTKEISDQTQRVKIIDSNGYILAENAPSYDVAIVPANLPSDTGSTEEIYRGLSELINVPVSNGVLTDATAKLFTPCETDFGIK